MVHWTRPQWNVFQYFVMMVKFRSPANGYYPNDSETLNLVLFSLGFATLVRTGVNQILRLTKNIVLVFLFKSDSTGFISLRISGGCACLIKHVCWSKSKWLFPRRPCE